MDIHNSGFLLTRLHKDSTHVVTQVGSRAVNLILWSYRHTGRATLWEKIFAYFTAFLGTFKKGP